MGFYILDGLVAIYVGTIVYSVISSRLVLKKLVNDLELDDTID